MNMKTKKTLGLVLSLVLIVILADSCKKDKPGNTTTGPVNVTLGQSYGGGIVGYILKAGDSGYDSAHQHGFIVSAIDQASFVQWSPNGINSLTGATGRAIGTGKSNTTLILAAYGSHSNAAGICDTLKLGGYTDWYLPSLAELDSIMVTTGPVVGFTNAEIYWSSSEKDDSSANGQSLAQAQLYPAGNYVCLKSVAHPVRMIRSF